MCSPYMVLPPHELDRPLVVWDWYGYVSPTGSLKIGNLRFLGTHGTVRSSNRYEASQYLQLQITCTNKAEFRYVAR